MHSAENFKEKHNQHHVNNKQNSNICQQIFVYSNFIYLVPSKQAVRTQKEIECRIVTCITMTIIEF